MVCGGVGRPDGLNEGYFTKPTIFADVTNEMTIAREEVFGPVLCMIKYSNEDEAIAKILIEWLNNIDEGKKDQDTNFIIEELIKKIK